MSSKVTSSSPAKMSEKFIGVPGRGASICTNPVTGSLFVAGLDPLEDQVRAAVHAIEARYRFSVANPGLPELPLTDEAATDYKSLSAQHCLVGLYAQSLKASGYSDNHPPFNKFAAAVLASPYSPFKYVHVAEVELLVKKYPPKEAANLGPGCCWNFA